MKLFGTIWFYILAIGVAAYAVFAYGFMPLGSLVHPDMNSISLLMRQASTRTCSRLLLLYRLAPFSSLRGFEAIARSCTALSAASIWALALEVGGLAGLYMSVDLPSAARSQS